MAATRAQRRMRSPFTAAEITALIAYHSRIIRTTRSADRKERARRAVDKLERMKHAK